MSAPYDPDRIHYDPDARSAVAHDLLRTLVLVLEDDGFEDVLRTFDPDSLTSLAKGRLGKLVAHFARNVNNEEATSDVARVANSGPGPGSVPGAQSARSDAERRRNAARGRQTTTEREPRPSEQITSTPRPRQNNRGSQHNSPGDSPANPWRSFFKSTAESFSFTPGVQAHLTQVALRRYNATIGGDPLDFLRDGTRLKHDAELCASFSTGDLILASYDYTLKLTARQDVDRCRWLHQMLTWYDVLKLIRPSSTVRRVGNMQIRQVKDFLAPIIADCPSLNLDIVTAHLDTWAKMGRKLDQLVAAQGHVFIFAFHKQLSDDFLQNKIVLSGDNYTQAMRHFDEVLRLRSAAGALEANRIGKDIRSASIKMYQDLRDQHPNHTDTEMHEN